ncbi:hypothetical protein [Desulfolutivibrio sp.]|uniref:hypothetical protein n=1 Tax=Desulfolutivibrio sp. TaxID=2773296 RepID=UPI002F960EB2
MRTSVFGAVAEDSARPGCLSGPNRRAAGLAHGAAAASFHDASGVVQADPLWDRGAAVDGETCREVEHGN